MKKMLPVANWVAAVTFPADPRETVIGAGPWWGESTPSKSVEDEHPPAPIAYARDMRPTSLSVSNLLAEWC